MNINHGNYDYGRAIKLYQIDPICKQLVDFIQTCMTARIELTPQHIRELTELAICKQVQENLNPIRNIDDWIAISLSMIFNNIIKIIPVKHGVNLMCHHKQDSELVELKKMIGTNTIIAGQCSCGNVFYRKE